VVEHLTFSVDADGRSSRHTLSFPRRCRTQPGLLTDVSQKVCTQPTITENVQLTFCCVHSIRVRLPSVFHALTAIPARHRNEVSSTCDEQTRGAVGSSTTILWTRVLVPTKVLVLTNNAWPHKKNAWPHKKCLTSQKMLGLKNQKIVVVKVLVLTILSQSACFLDTCANVARLQDTLKSCATYKLCVRLMHSSSMPSLTCQHAT
jgi:hypothetical protein